jgi:MFS family permease
MIVSDKYGRKKILLATMVGNIVSAAIWLRSTTFVSCLTSRKGYIADEQSTYLLSRLVGGLSEGNVQISTAIISDVTTAATRSRSLALIGIAFSICFTIG